MDNSIVAISPDDLQLVAKSLLKKHPNKRIFAFYAPMGAGKTTFIRALCHRLGAKDNVASPTFAIINEYLSESGQTVYHFDFYRIKKLEEAMDIGSEEYFYSGSYCFIEWPELIEDILPEEAVKVKIRVDEETGNRIFTF